MSAPLMAARMSAWVALLAALVVCGALAVLVFRNLLTLLLVLVALAVAGAALWLALSRRGRQCAGGAGCSRRAGGARTCVRHIRLRVSLGDPGPDGCRSIFHCGAGRSTSGPP